MHTATVQRRHAPKHPPLYNSPASASLPRDSEKKIFFSDNLCHRRWETIVSKGRS